MFDFIRNHKRWMQFVLLLLILPSFALVGVQGYTTYISQDNEVAIVNGEPISRQAFDRALSNALEQERQNQGANYDPEQVNSPALRALLIEQLVDQATQAQTASNFRFSVSDEQLRRYIAQQPMFQENGSFSPDLYRQLLANQGLDPVSYEAMMRGSIATNRVLQPLGANIDASTGFPQPLQSSLRVPDALLLALYENLSESRTVQLERFTAGDYVSKVEVTDADVRKWYDENGESLRLPEYVDAQFVILDEASARAGVTVSDEDILSFYEQNKSAYSTPERRRASHIQISVAPGASADERAAAKARATELTDEARRDPAAFDKLARENSQDIGTASVGGDLGWIGRTDFPVAALAEAVYQLPAKDAISDPVETEYGYHVIKLSDFQPSSITPLEKVRDEITEEILTQKASARFADSASRLTSLVYDNQDSLQPVVEALSLPIGKADGISRTGLLDAATVGAGAASANPATAWLNTPRVRQALFSADVLGKGQNTGVIELSPNQLVALRVAEVHPSAIPPLEQVSSQIRARLVDERAQAAAQAAGAEALKRYQAERPEPLPAAFGPQLTLSRAQPGSMSTQAMNIIAGVQADQAPAFVGLDDGADYVIVYVDKVNPAPAIEPETLADLRMRLDYLLGESQKAAVLQALRQSLEAKVLPEGQRAITGEGEEAGDSAS